VISFKTPKEHERILKIQFSYDRTNLEPQCQGGKRNGYTYHIGVMDTVSKKNVHIIEQARERERERERENQPGGDSPSK
jgi:hypothetical protein